MKHLLSILAFSFLIFSSVGASAITIEDFESYQPDKLPSSWRTWPFQRGKAASVYKVELENGNKYLSAYDASDLSVQILRNIDWKVKEFPILFWKWRPKTLPLNGNETDPAANDSACGVYVILSKARREMIKYTWSTTAPVGSVYEKNPGKAYIIVIKSGVDGVGKWHQEKIDIIKDYKKYFHKELDKNPAAIAILTDGNATHSPSACDYDDFKI